ncbi:unnamed protein product [Trypanosoma congolense IL3000]|uniref:WGS project CAEQ00000000 data, annotated contig 960 n=1 Tax=Trypanosoma congolense (strain IL3000) TaxID=1068625 RepID=F9WJW5_TRYCI|nr:unnamed protein product [Trypanosoma congolense IL3000]
MGESDRTNEERMHQLFKEEVEEWVDQVVEGLEIFAQGDLQAESDRVEQWDNLQNLASDIMGECVAMVGGLQGGEEAIGMTRESLEEIHRLLEDFCQLAEEEYGNREEEVSPVVHEIIKEVEAWLEKGEEEEAAKVLRENWGRLIEASGGDGHEWEDWRRRLEAAREKVEEARNKVKEAEKNLEQAREVEQKAREEREKALEALLWRNEQWEQAIKEFGRSEEEHVAKPDVERLRRELEKLDRRVTDAEIARKARENELEKARRELENWNTEFERMTQAPGATRTLRAWVLAVSESDDVEKELAKARGKQADCECRLFLAEGLHHLAAATQGVDAAERELEEALEEWERAREELKETEEKLWRFCLVADDPPSGQDVLERCEVGAEKARLVALEECWEALKREWKRLEESENIKQHAGEALEGAGGAWARLRLERAENEWDRVIQKLKEFSSGGVPARDAVEALKSRVEECQEELKAAKDMCPTEVLVERVLTLEGLEELVKSELELEKCKEELERTLHDSDEWRQAPQEARRRLDLAVQEWARALQKAETAGGGWVRVCDAMHRAERLLEAGKQALSRANRRKEACQAVVKVCEEALQMASLRSPGAEDEVRKCQEVLDQWRQEFQRWEEEDKRCAEELAQIESEVPALVSAQNQLQRAKNDLARANKEWEEARQKVQESTKEFFQKARECWEKVFKKRTRLLETPDFQSLERSLEQALTNKPWEPRPDEAEAWATVCKQYRNWKNAHQKVVACEEALRKRSQELREALHESEETCLRRKKLERASEAFEKVRKEWEKAHKEWEKAHKEWEKIGLDSARRTATEACQDVKTCGQAFVVARQRRATSAQAFLQASRRRQALKQLLHLWSRVPNESPAVDTAPSSSSDPS